MNRYTSFAVFIFSAIALIVPSGYSIGPVLLLLGSVILLRRKESLPLNREDRILMTVFFLYSAISVAMNLLHGEIGKEYDMPLRFALAIPALMLLRAYPPSPAYFWAGLGVGGITSGSFAAWQTLFLMQDRAGGNTNPIQYGNVSFIIGILCLAGIGWALSQKHKLGWIVFLICGAVMGMLGTIFTGSRGSWIGLPFCLLILYRCYGGEMSKRYVWGSIATVIIALVVVYEIPRLGVKARTELAVTEAMAYVKTHNAKTSIGTRMELWRTGILAAMEQPLLGMGKAGFVAWEAKQVKLGLADPVVSEHSHAHNEWIDVMAKRGIPGLIALLSLYYIVLRTFITKLKNGERATRPYAISGILLVVNYICFGFTQVALSHISGVMILAFTTVILWGLLRGEERRQ